MINYVEKGPGLHDAIHKAGYTFARTDGVWASSDDVAVQAIIDVYDALPGARADAIIVLKKGANETILARYTLYKQLNMLMRMAEIQEIRLDGNRALTTAEEKEAGGLRTAAVWIRAIRAESQIHETAINAEADWILCDELAQAGIVALQVI